MDISLPALLDLNQTTHVKLFADKTMPWEVLVSLNDYLTVYPIQSQKATIHPTAVIEGLVIFGSNVEIGPYAYLQGPIVIGDNTKIGVGAYIRPNTIIGNHCVIGHSSELKHCVLFNHVTLPHFNYVGDSILGYKVHFGGGAMAANYRSDGGTICVVNDKAKFDTGLNKFGAIIGDHVEVGANVVMNPGVIIGRQSVIYAGAVIRGCIPSDTIVKYKAQLELVQKT